MLAEVDFMTEFDLNIEPPCEYSHHGHLKSSGSAYYFVLASCPDCSDQVRFLIGKDCFDKMQSSELQCDCGYVCPTNEIWTVLQVL